MAASLARALRAQATDAERVLWSKLRDRRLQAFKFQRQVPLGPYVVDFCSLRARLIVEVDGGQHGLRELEDEKRSGWLAAEGFRIIRFWNNEVLGNPDGVLRTILIALREARSPRRSPRNGEGDLERHRPSVQRQRRTPASPSEAEHRKARTIRGTPPLPSRREGRPEGIVRPQAGPGGER